MEKRRSEVFFDEGLGFRLRGVEVVVLDEIVKNNNVVYPTRSDFIRVAVVKLIKFEVDKDGKKRV